MLKTRILTALVLLAGSAAGVAWKLGFRPWLMVLGGSLAAVAIGEILLFVLSIGLTPIAAVAAAPVRAPAAGAEA